MTELASYSLVSRPRTRVLLVGRSSSIRSRNAMRIERSHGSTNRIIAGQRARRSGTPMARAIAAAIASAMAEGIGGSDGHSTPLPLTVVTSCSGEIWLNQVQIVQLRNKRHRIDWTW